MRVKLSSAACLLTFFFLLIIGCQRDIDNPLGNNGNNSHANIWKTAGVTGQVIEANGKPVDGAEVKFGNSTTQTDINGYFSFANVSFSTGEAFVTVKKQGFFTGSRTFYPRQGGSNNYVKIRLLPRLKVGSIDAGSGGEVELRNGMTIELPANGIATAGGGSYSGDVEVSTAYLDPTASDINERMPGDLRGIVTGNNQVILKSFGMVAVELNSPSGQPLNIKPGSAATLTFPIPASLSGTAPATIPLWYFDETTGLWKAEGLATKQGDQYVGQVSHFSFWNVDVPCQFIKLSVKIVSPANEPVAGAKVRITSLADGTSAYDFTDNTGYVEGAVPKGLQLKLEVFDNCNNVVVTQTIGPFNTDTDLGSIQITTNVGLQTITGTVKNCAGNPLASGTVMVKLSNNQAEFTTVQNGAFSITFLTCSGATSAGLIAIDDNAQQQGNPVTVMLNATTVNAGQLQACGVSLEAVINFTVDGSLMTWTNTNSEIILSLEDTSYTYPNGDHALYIAAGDTSETSTQPILQIIFKHPPGNIIAPASLAVAEDLFVYDLQNGDFVTYTPLNPVSGLITMYGAIGQPVQGTLNGQFVRDNNGIIDTVTVNCTFKVLRNDPAYWF